MPEVKIRTYETIDARKRSVCGRPYGKVIVYEFLRDGRGDILSDRFVFRTMKAAERFIKFQRAKHGESVH